MSPELVIANSAVRSYPGGIKAVRAVDWLGGARGTLSSESNANASTGQVVRDQQQFTLSATNWADSDYAAADDTLSIAVSDIGLEDGRDYQVWVTYYLDGEWDVTNSTRLRQSTIMKMGNFAIIGMEQSSDGAPSFVNNLIGHTPHFSVAQLYTFLTADTAATLTLKAWSLTGSTFEVLIDQIVFLPDSKPGGTTQDVQRGIGGVNVGQFTTAITDGADGGDANGKFTVQRIGTTLDGYSSSTAWDYQHFDDPADAEYFLQIVEADALQLHNDAGAAATAAHYSLHAARYKHPTYVDDFDNRTTTPGLGDMGIDQNGFGYRVAGTGTLGTDSDAYVDSGNAYLQILQDGFGTTLGSVWVEWGDDTGGGAGPGPNQQGARITENAFGIFSGVLAHTGGSLSDANWNINFGDGTISYWLKFDPDSASWGLYDQTPGPTYTQVGSTQDISGWYAAGELFGFKIELKRYVIRARVWDASSTEPSTWDVEAFRRSRVGSTNYAYSYSDVFARAQAAYFTQGGLGIEIRSDGFGGNTLPYEVTIYQLGWEQDPYGDPDDIQVQIEHPEGSVVGNQVVPYGCPYFVYWGSRIWTGATTKLDFSTRAMNVSTAAELQRAETVFHYFIVSPVSRPQIYRRVFG